MQLIGFPPELCIGAGGACHTAAGIAMYYSLSCSVVEHGWDVLASTSNRGVLNIEGYLGSICNYLMHYRR